MALYKRGRTYHVDVTVNGLRFRQSLETTNWQEAQRKQKEFIADALAGKAALPVTNGSFASLRLETALDEFVARRRGRVAERTSQIDAERSKPLKRHLGSVRLLKVSAETIRQYQDKRQAEGVSGRTINTEVTVLRQILKRAKRWNVLADAVSNLPEGSTGVGRVLTREEKAHLFRTASSKPAWEAAYFAAVIAVNTTCRKIEVLTLRWQAVDFANRLMIVQKSKTAAGCRTIPLNTDAISALERLSQRAKLAGGGLSDQFVFPACENNCIDFARPQKTVRSAWRRLTKTAGLAGFRFHDLRHQSITEMAEAGVPESTMQSIAGHLSKRMLDHYCHVRIQAKRSAVAVLTSMGSHATPEVSQVPHRPQE